MGEIIKTKNVRPKKLLRKAGALKGVLGHGEGLMEQPNPQTSRGDYKVSDESEPRKVHHLQKHHPAVLEEAGLALNSGMTGAEVEARYGVHRGYVASALNRAHIDPLRAKKALANIVLENAVAVQAVAATKIEDMTGPQAVFAGKILIESLVEIEKNIKEAPKTIDFGALKRVGDSIEKLRSVVRPVEG